METDTFGALIKTQPSLILFVPMNNKEINTKILNTVCNLTYNNLRLSM